MTAQKAMLIVLLMYVVSVLCRVPNLDRPLSKHHEFNPATILIASEAWMERGGGYQYGFVPMINYAKPGDYVKDKDLSNDGKGNGIYLSYGPGMYIIPYFIFKVFHLPVQPLSLQCINLAFLLLSVIMLFRLLALVFSENKRQYELVALGCFLFLFNPCILWFLGNGFVNVTISLPFLIGAIHQALIIFYKKKNSYLNNYVWLSFFIIAGIYIDWNAFFAALVIAVFGVAKSRFRKIPVVAWVAGLSALLGVFLIIKQYSTYLSLEQITTYWKSRFLTRSVEDTGIGLPQKMLLLATNLLSGYFPLVLLCIYSIIRYRKKMLVNASPIPKAFLKIAAFSCILYNLTFFNWSYIHDFSLVPLSVLLIFIPLYFISFSAEKWMLSVVLCLYFILTISQYYYINRPGKISQNGTEYKEFKSFGEMIKQTATPDEMIFSPEPTPMANFYGKRFVFQAKNAEDAKLKLREWHYPKGLYIIQLKPSVYKIERIVP